MKRVPFFGALLCVTLLSCASFLPAPAYAQRELKDIPPADPELERATFVVADGFEVNLFAADPLMAKPIQMNFDARGRLWIASSEVYPQIKPGQQATDKILVLEDRDGDGQADHTTVFADGLLIPTGVAPDLHGAYVANSTELIYLHDTDGDGKADQQRTILSGFGTEDTHHLLHTLRWGPDGCLYMNQSIYIHSHVETPYGVKRLNGGGIWRFRPETMRLDVFCEGFVNPWGHHFDRWGQSFATDGAYGEGINYVFPGAVFVTAPGAKRILSGLNPGSPKHCGLEIVSGGHLPDSWQGNMLTNDFRAHRVCRFVVTEEGSGYASRQEVEVIKSSHVAFRPIDVKMGPDGAIYIADWYNPIIQHGEVDFRDPRRDHVHGRIWRVTAKGRDLVPRRKLVDASPDELLEALRAPEDWTRLHAKLILKSRDREATLTALRTWLGKLPAGQAETEPLRLETLWTHEALDVPNPQLLRELLASPDHRVRAAAQRTLIHWLDRLDEPFADLRRGVLDEHPRVRLEAVRGLAQVRTVDSAATALLVLDRPMDQNLDFALWRTMRDLEPVWLPEVMAGRLTFGGNVDHLTFALKAVESPGVVQPLLTLLRENKVRADQMDGVLSVVAALGGPAEMGVALRMALQDGSTLTPAAKAAVLNGLRDATARRRVIPEGDLNRLAGLIEAQHEPLRGAVIRAAGAWKVESLRPKLETLLRTAETPPGVRDAAFEALVALAGERSVRMMRELAAPKQEVDIRIRAVTALATLDPRSGAADAVVFLQAPEAERMATPVAQAFLAQKTGPAALAAALTDRELPADVAKRLLRAVQSSPQPDARLLDAIRHAGKLTEAGWKATPELVADLVRAVQEHGDPARGEALYRRADLQCTKCHAIGGAGGRVGPDLVSIGATAQLDYLVMSLIAPNDKIKENYHSKVVETDAGLVLTGIPIRETKTELVLRDAEDREIVVPADTIESRVDGRSLMPDGAVDLLTRDELADLIRFLSELGKVGPYAIGPQQVARRWQVLTWTPEAHQLLNRNSFDIAATDHATLIWQPIYSQVNGALPLEGLPTFTPHRDIPPTVFLRCELEVTTPGSLDWTVGSKGIQLWVDGKPTPLSAQLDWTSGRHTLTFAIDRAAHAEPLRLEVRETAGAGRGKGNFVLGK